MRKRSNVRAKAAPEKTKRNQRMVCLMSEEERRIVEHYLKQHRITNKSRWLRETLLTSIYRSMEAEYPTLFGEHEMRR